VVLHLVAYVFPAVVALAAVPMLLGRLSPNGSYGYRTSKTLSSTAIWYKANRFAGWAFLIGMALTILCNLLVWRMHPDWPTGMLILWMCAPMSVAPLLSLMASSLYVRKL